MSDGPYTPGGMDAARGASESRDSRFDELYAEAKSTLGYGANNLRSVTERYREAYRDTLGRWHSLRDQVEVADRAPLAQTDSSDAAAAAEAGAEDARLKALRFEAERLTGDLGRHQQELSKLELSVRSMENAWLFLERGDASLLAEVADAGLATDMQMRIVQAQEAERSRLAQEVHDGPAQALSNAIFQVEYIERVITRGCARRQQRAAFPARAAPSRARRGPDLHQPAASAVARRAGPGRLDHGCRRKHGGPDRGDRRDGSQGAWGPAQPNSADGRPADRPGGTAERPKARRFQSYRRVDAASRRRTGCSKYRTTAAASIVGAVAARGRRNFGLQFMRERAELIGAQFEVRSRPGGGTVVGLSIPVGEENA